MGQATSEISIRYLSRHLVGGRLYEYIIQETRLDSTLFKFWESLLIGGGIAMRLDEIHCVEDPMCTLMENDVLSGDTSSPPGYLALIYSRTTLQFYQF